MIQKTREQILKARPSYRDILDFYGKVFIAREKSKQSITLAPVQIKPDLLKVKLKSKMPLIDPSQFLIDMEPAQSLFIHICDLAVELAPKLSASADLARQAVEKKTLKLETLYTDMLSNQTDQINTAAKAVNIPEKDLVLFAYLSMVPSIEIGAEQLAFYLGKDHIHKKGYCPVCGNLPDLAYFDENGKRHLKCCYCHHKWDYVRMGCVFCGKTETSRQQYFYSAQEKEYRVDLCDLCHNYIKVVDTRQMDRGFYPELEMISTLHLDMKAKEIGYTSQTSLGVG